MQQAENEIHIAQLIPHCYDGRVSATPMSPDTVGIVHGSTALVDINLQNSAAARETLRKCNRTSNEVAPAFIDTLSQGGLEP